MKTFNAEFIKGAVDLEGMPQTVYPETAFAGRSNVGKSSLINSIVNRKNLARISSAPGKTREINFFLVDNKWMLADLPGFGYAKTNLKTREKWLKLNYGYLESRDKLKFVCCLIDSRHDPQKTDMILLEWLVNNNKNFIVVLTKCDKIKPKAIEDRVTQIKELLAQCDGLIDIIPYSVETGLGWKHLTSILKNNLV